MSYLKGIARKYVTGARNEVQTLYWNASTDDIISIIHHADRQSQPYTQQFAQYLSERHGTDKRAILKDVWELLKSLRYKADDGHQKIKSPAQLISDGVGDCKSFSVFIASLCKNLGIKYVYRYADYDRDNDVNHVYIVAYPDAGKPVVVDAVHTAFNSEAPGANYIFDIDPQKPDVRTQGKRIAGIGQGRSSSSLYFAVAAGIVFLILKTYRA